LVLLGVLLDAILALLALGAVLPPTLRAQRPGM